MTARLSLTGTPHRLDGAFSIAFWLFVGTIAFSVAGTLLLKLVPATMGFFGPFYPTLVKTPTWTYMTLMPVLTLLLYAPTHRASLLGFFFVWGSLVGGMSELMGTSIGLPFGEYLYTDWFGPKFLDHVPYFIPTSWFAMGLICHDLASRLTSRRLQRILVAATLMVIWDVSLDPAMNRAFPFWTYPEGGFFFGMPAINWFGWFVVSAAIAWGFEAIGGGLRAGSRWAPTLYALNCLFPILVSFTYDLPLAGVVGVLATAIPLLALHGRGLLRGDWRFPPSEPESRALPAPTGERPHAVRVASERTPVSV